MSPRGYLAAQANAIDIAFATAPASLLADRASSPPGRVSTGSQGFVGARRDDARQWQLVPAAPRTHGKAGGADARASAYRLDRRMRRSRHRLRAVTGHGGNQRSRHLFLHPSLEIGADGCLKLLAPQRHRSPRGIELIWRIETPFGRQLPLQLPMISSLSISDACFFS